MDNDAERLAPVDELQPGEAVDLCNRLAASLRLVHGHDFQGGAWEKLARVLAQRFDSVAVATEEESIWRLLAEETGELGSQSPIVTRPEGESRKVLSQIANWPDEDDEWDAVEKYKEVRELAKKGLEHG